MRNRSAGIVIRNGNILLMKRIKKGVLYYTIPGGSTEKDESFSQAAEREIFEETRVSVRAKQLLYRYELDTGEVQEYYLTEYISGEPKLELSEELGLASADNIFEPLFMSVERLSSVPLLPEMLKERLVQDLKVGFQKEPHIFKVPASSYLGYFQKHQTP